jgi:uncharacterized protein YndB with AHSA1/START domain
MNIRIQPAPVRRSIAVKAAPDKAFTVFATRIGDWWPRSHSIGKSPQADVRLEPKAGGRWYEIGTDGSECPWGHVIAWEPPLRLLLAWQIGANWQYDPTLVTEVEIRFTARPEGGTLVELEHRLLERYGEAAEAVRTNIDSEGGWAGILALFAGVADAA